MLIVGLGNPGSKYLHNRHTVGHMFVDWVASQIPHSTWHIDSHKLFDYQKITSEAGRKMILAKTRSYMNDSGRSVLAMIRYFDVTDVKTLVVAHDDLDLAVGDWKLDFAKGPKQHNGINSIESSNRTNLFWRLRIGVDNRTPDRRIPGETYVLQDFADEEHSSVVATFPLMWERVLKNTYDTIV